MSDVFISYARSTEAQAALIAAVLRGLGFDVWRDDELPAHRAYGDVIEERLSVAGAVLVLWSADAAKSQWVRAEANRGREEGKLVQLRLDDTRLPMPFDQIQCADLTGWTGDTEAQGWRTALASLAQLLGHAADPSRPAAPEPAIPLPDRASIAVLPFADMTGDLDQDYFVEGMVDDITTAMSRFPSLSVIANSSTLAFRAPDRNLRSIARLLRVRYLLEGSVRKSGKKVRVSINLADAVEDLSVWSERFDGDFEDIFALQDAIANAVVGKLEATLETAEIRRVGKHAETEHSARELYLLALPKIYAWDYAETLEALRILNLAISIDGASALALSGAAFCHAQIFESGLADDPEAARRASLDLSQRALRIDGHDPEVLGWCATATLECGGDIAHLDAMVERALARNPNVSRLCNMSSFLKIYRGQPTVALERVETAIHLDPRSTSLPFNLMSKGICLFSLRRFDEALPLLSETRQHLPAHRGTQGYLAATLAHLDRLPEARAVFAAIRDGARNQFATGPYDPDHRALLREGLTLAGADFAAPVTA